MPIKSSTHIIKGMMQDSSPSKASPEYAVDALNIRITARENTSLLSVVNEKGNSKVPLKNKDGSEASTTGTYIGSAVLNQYFVLFTHVSDTVDNIYRLEKMKDSSNKEYFELVLLFTGNLNLSSSSPIETQSIFENADILKVYWTDGINQPRMINIVASDSIRALWTDTSFDFTRKLKLLESVSVSRNLVANGVFAPGVILYAFTYYNKYALESNIFYTSPLFYVSYNNRGAAADSSVSNSFDIEISNLDYSFDYVRIYSILRTSLDATTVCKRVTDLALPTSQFTQMSSNETKIPSSASAYISIYDGNNLSYTTKEVLNLKLVAKNSSVYIKYIAADGTETIWYNSCAKGDIIELTSASSVLGGQTMYDFKVTVNRPTSIVYTDTGTSGDSIEPTELLYVGGEEVLFGTMTLKDGTLFLGDISLKRKLLNANTRSLVLLLSVDFDTDFHGSEYGQTLTIPYKGGYYPYDNLLKKSSSLIKTFKYLEYYRFGIQALHYTGKWSEPIWICDKLNKTTITTYGSSVFFPYASTTIGSDLINELLSLGYVNVRPVIVFPTINDREVLCLGILCPTVYNVLDRYGNSPFALSSWFVRPNSAFDFTKDASNWSSVDSYGYFNSPASSINNHAFVPLNLGTSTVNIDLGSKGNWAEFRHNYPIPSNNNRNAEILCIYNPPTDIYFQSTDLDGTIAQWVSEHLECYYVDESILTFHSPDIEFDDLVRSIDSSSLKLRIVGRVPITATVSDLDILTSTPVNAFLAGGTTLPVGFYKEPVGDIAMSIFGWRLMLAGSFWFDELSKYKDGIRNSHYYSTGFVVYPWHRNGSLNNTKYNNESGYKSALLKEKRMSNMMYSSYTDYFYNPWYAYDASNKDIHTGISGVSIFDSNEVSLVRIPAPLNSGLDDLNYYGNIDKLLVPSRIGANKDGYPIITSGIQSTATNAHTLYVGDFITPSYTLNGTLPMTDVTDDTTGVDPVRIKYKSTPHAVIALNYTTDGKLRVLPTIRGGNSFNSWIVNSVDGNLPLDEEHTNVVSLDTIYHLKYAFWDKKHTTAAVSQDVVGGAQNYGFLWMGELYNDNVENRFGGLSEEAFENNIWLPCGEKVALKDILGLSLTSVSLKWVEGDTYYQRYDHLKTYPFTTDDINQVTSIISFMCETRVNIDGRTDRNRGQTSNLAITPTNFNLINKVYSLKNNFFTYNTINPNKLNLDNFHNSITWTKTKSVGELVDTWTNITLASTLDLDGDKGKVRALKRFNNDIIAFQDRGISDILFNSRTLVSSTDGVPIEIANSGKVEGKRYIANNVGCSNKWSMTESLNGIYFADRETNSIYLFNGQLTSLTDKYGFRKWLGDLGPYFDNFKSFCDKNNSDVYFNVNNGDSTSQCLCFSEFLSLFTSFMDYKDVNTMFNIDSDFYAWKNNSLWHNFDGDYNMFFGEFKPFSITVVDNADEALDKVFNNIDFRADSWDGTTPVNSTFDTLDVWDEYQHGTESLVNTKDKPSTLKRKFRIWRANIPRDNSNHRDRIRNTWAYIKLALNNANKYKTELHDLNVQYFV